VSTPPRFSPSPHRGKFPLGPHVNQCMLFPRILTQTYVDFARPLSVSEPPPSRCSVRRTHCEWTVVGPVT
jgi:hypothetical protein